MTEPYAHERQLLAELQAKITPADRARALGAFTRVLDDAGFNAWTASDAALQLEAWDIAGFPEDGKPAAPPGAAAAWRDAVEAARVELCDKAPFVSAEAFGLVNFLGGDHGDLPAFRMLPRGN